MRKAKPDAGNILGRIQQYESWGAFQSLCSNIERKLRELPGQSTSPEQVFSPFPPAGFRLRLDGKQIIVDKTPAGISWTSISLDDKQGVPRKESGMLELDGIFYSLNGKRFQHMEDVAVFFLEKLAGD